MSLDDDLTRDGVQIRGHVEHIDGNEIKPSERLGVKTDARLESLKFETPTAKTLQSPSC